MDQAGTYKCEVDYVISDQTLNRASTTASLKVRGMSLSNETLCFRRRITITNSNARALKSGFLLFIYR